MVGKKETHKHDPNGYGSKISLLSRLVLVLNSPLILSIRCRHPILINFEVNGERYQKIRRVFGQGWGEYRGAINIITKYIGGSYIYRDHIGDPGNRVPLNIVPAKEQRRALKILNDKIFDKNAFSFSPDVLNKLLPERFWNFRI